MRMDITSDENKCELYIVKRNDGSAFMGFNTNSESLSRILAEAAKSSKNKINIYTAPHAFDISDQDPEE